MKFEIIHDTMNIAVNYTIFSLYIMSIFLNRSIRTKPSITLRFYHISVLIAQNHSGSAMVLETDQRETTMQRCG